MYPVRNSVKAIILKNNKILCIEKNDKNGNYYILPGGGQEKYETFIDTLKRECIEEIGAVVKTKKLLFIREYIGKNHEFAETDNDHQVEFMFECELLEEPDISKASKPDNGQISIKWIDVNGSDRLYPKCLKERLLSNYKEIYWGDIN